LLDNGSDLPDKGAYLLDNSSGPVSKALFVSAFQQEPCLKADRTAGLPGVIILAMILFWSRPMVRKKSTGKVSVPRASILRAVASSSAIETGERIEDIEKRLKSRSRRTGKFTLAS